jgi:hypothetical protein
MPPCPSCGADRVAAATKAPCPKCGATPAAAGALDFELDVPKRSAAKTPGARKSEDQELTLELAVDPRSFTGAPPVEPGREESRALAVEAPPSAPRAGSPAASALVSRGARAEALLTGASVGDLAFDARLLAEYGEPPRHWLLSPLYAWRVLRRQRELKRALAGRREEAVRAAHEVEDALVAFAERSRAAAEKRSEFAPALDELRGAEDLLRSRDRVLASEQDAQTARLASVDARLANLEAELARAQAEERAIAAELASTQAGLARGETKLKRAESELRSAQQREADGTRA